MYRIFTIFVAMIFLMQPINIVLAEEQENIKISGLDLKQMEILEVLKLLSMQSGKNIVASKAVKGRISVFLKDVNVYEALDIIADAYDLAIRDEVNVIKVMTESEYEEKFNRPYGTKLKTAMYSLRYVDAKNVLNIIKDLKSKDGRIISAEDSKVIILIDQKEYLELMQQAIKLIDRPVITEVFPLIYASAKDVADKFQNYFGSPRTKIDFDSLTNQVMISDHIETISKAREIVKALDIQPQEVLIEAKIIQIALSDQYKLGVDWQAILNDVHDVSLSSNFNALQPADKAGRFSVGTVDQDNYQLMVDALEELGETNILSSPSITAVDKEEARILVGSTEPYVTTTTTTTASGPATTAESVNFIEVGVKLHVTPTIHSDQFVTMKIKPEVSTVTRTIITNNNNVIPVVETSEAETTVRVKDNVTIVIGGLIKDEQISSRKEVPLMGRIPVLGAAFRNTDDFKRKTEIVIFLTPTIISGDKDIVLNELKQGRHHDIVNADNEVYKL